LAYLGHAPTNNEKHRESFDSIRLAIVTQDDSSFVLRASDSGHQILSGEGRFARERRSTVMDTQVTQ
jgi:hypothetical protein